MRPSNQTILVIIITATVSIIGIITHRNTQTNSQQALHAANIKQLLNAAWEEAKEGTTETFEEFTDRLNTEYKEAMDWVKTKSQAGQEQTQEKIEEFRQKMEAARVKGRNKLATYFQEVADNLKVAADKK